MQQGQFRAAAMQELKQAEKGGSYANARFAPQGNEKVGKPFPLFRQSGAYFTDWTPSGQTTSNLKRQANLPTNNTAFRQGMIADGVGQANRQNYAWTYRTQTLSNNGESMACVNNADCESWPGTSCNGQYQDWSSAKGNQGNYCSTTIYPEMEGGTYHRKNSNEGGIGRSCTHNGDCGKGYFCNNETDAFGKNIQQTGFCSQTYECPGGEKQYMGYPNNAGTPQPPSKDQNNKGRGYISENECKDNADAQQNCIKDDKGKWFATYPGYCPVPSNLRQGANPMGALSTSSPMALSKGITLPGYANSKPSHSTVPLKAFSAWNINSSASQVNNIDDPLQYELSVNPPTGL
jgi:hypothetical protein